MLNVDGGRDFCDLEGSDCGIPWTVVLSSHLNVCSTPLFNRMTNVLPLTSTRFKLPGIGCSANGFFAEPSSPAAWTFCARWQDAQIQMLIMTINSRLPPLAYRPLIQFNGGLFPFPSFQLHDSPPDAAPLQPAARSVGPEC